MKKRLSTSLTILLILSSYSFSFSMNNDQDQYIEFEGKKQFIPALIMASTLSNKHPFSITPIIRYDGGQLIVKGDILNLEKQDLNDIKNKNYIYCDFFRLQKTRLSDEEFVSVGALILGTKDVSIAEELPFFAMDLTMDNFNKFQED
jgi:hypothetical protein